MDYEKRIKYLLASDEIDNNHKAVLLDLFPELGESEDERIRKALIRFHKSTIEIDGIKGADIIAWLEKQREQNYRKPCIGELVELGNVIEYIESGKSGYKGGISYLKTLKEDLYKL